MNDDASTYELPEYIHSRLQPQILLDFPEQDEEKQILATNLPFSDEQILTYVTRFLRTAHAADEPYTVRDGVNIARYALKLLKQHGADIQHATGARRRHLRVSIEHVLGKDALRHFPE
jgi:MoxR-like ATPase